MRSGCIDLAEEISESLSGSNAGEVHSRKLKQPPVSEWFVPGSNGKDPDSIGVGSSICDFPWAYNHVLACFTCFPFQELLPQTHKSMCFCICLLLVSLLPLYQ